MIERQLEGCSRPGLMLLPRAGMRGFPRSRNEGSGARTRARGRPHALHEQASGGAAPRGGSAAARASAAPTGSVRPPTAWRRCRSIPRTAARSGSRDGAASVRDSAFRNRPPPPDRDVSGCVEAAPCVEQQLTAVQRDYELEKQQYSHLSEKLNTASMAERWRAAGAAKITVLYLAALPTKPTKPIPCADAGDAAGPPRGSCL